jgi:hypothetical protein
MSGIDHYQSTLWPAPVALVLKEYKSTQCRGIDKSIDATALNQSLQAVTTSAKKRIGVTDGPPRVQSQTTVSPFGIPERTVPVPSQKKNMKKETCSSTIKANWLTPLLSAIDTKS